MLSPRLSNCIECSTIPVLLNQIDCKIKELAQKEYNNIVFSFNRSIKGEVMKDLLNYKRILTYKYCNPDYASCFSVEQIASKVKLLIHK
jgi:hypothetical protein